MPLTLPLVLALVQAQPGASRPVPLYTDLGNHAFPITTTVPRAQDYFNQGIRLTYAFNHAEAIRAFGEAARLDPRCATCYWGIALAYGPNINAPMDSASGVAAYRAIERARTLAPGVSAREQAYIRALSVRYASVPPAERTSLDSAYARAMAQVARAYPGDLDAQVFYAEALMDLSPWNYWQGTEPRAGTAEFLGRLEYALSKNPDHPGACHFYIHAVEAAYPDRAVACSERLPALMPGAGHVVHMPSHIYIRVGRYAEAVDRNVHAVHEDERYIADQHPDGMYPSSYYPHNYHFLAFAATLAGRSAVALEAARQTVKTVPPEVAATVPFLEGLPAYAHLAAVTFGRWEDVLREPMPPAGPRTATGLAFYARGVALAATGRWSEAQTAQDSLTAIVQWSRKERPGNGATQVLEIADQALQGEVALRRGQAAEAVTHFRAAAELEDKLTYNEPPDWYYPMRHSLGKALLAAKRPVEAERFYREDLARFPENGWSLLGLALSLEAQGKTAEATTARARFERAWKASGADVPLPASRW